MDPTFMAVACGLYAALALGVADFFAAKAARYAGAMTAAVAVNIVGALGFILFYLLAFPFSEHHLTLAGIVTTLGAAIFLAFGQISLFKALKIGPVSLVCPLTSIYPLFVTFGVIFFFNAPYNPFQIGCVLLIVLGALAASGFFESGFDSKAIGKGPLIALLTAFFWGIGYLILTKALEMNDWQSVSFIQLTVIALICLLLSSIAGRDEQVTSQLTSKLFLNRYILATGLIQMSAIVVLSIGLAIKAELAPVVMAVSACYPAVTILLALRHFNEERKIIPLSGAVLCVVAIVLLILNTH